MPWKRNSKSWPLIAYLRVHFRVWSKDPLCTCTPHFCQNLTVKKFVFAISSSDEFLLCLCTKISTDRQHMAVGPEAKFEMSFFSAYVPKSVSIDNTWRLARKRNSKCRPWRLISKLTRSMAVAKRPYDCCVGQFWPNISVSQRRSDKKPPMSFPLAP